MCCRCWPKPFHGLRQHVPSRIPPPLHISAALMLVLPDALPEGAVAVPVVLPIPLPLTNVLCIMGFPTISALCRLCYVVPAMGTFPPNDNVFACCVIITAAHPGIPSVRGSNIGALLLPQPLPPPNMISNSLIAFSKGFLAGCVQFLVTFSSASSSSRSFSVPVVLPDRFPALCDRAIAALSSACAASNSSSAPTNLSSPYKIAVASSAVSLP